MLLLACSFQQLFEPLRPSLFRYALRAFQNEQDAQDMTQEVALRSYRKWNLFQWGNNFHHWVFAIMRNLVINTLVSRDFRSKQLEKYPDAFPIGKFLDSVRAEDLVRGPKKPRLIWKRRVKQQRLAWILLEAIHPEMMDSPHIRQYKQKLETDVKRFTGLLRPKR